MASSFPRSDISFKPTPLTFGNATNRSLRIHRSNDSSRPSSSTGTEAFTASYKVFVRIPQGMKQVRVQLQHNTGHICCQVLLWHLTAAAVEQYLSTGGPIYKISYDLPHDYRKFVVRST